VIKSMENEVQDRSEISCSIRNSQGLCLESFERQQISQDLIYYLLSFNIDYHQ